MFSPAVVQRSLPKYLANFLKRVWKVVQFCDWRLPWWGECICQVPLIPPVQFNALPVCMHCRTSPIKIIIKIMIIKLMIIKIMIINCPIQCSDSLYALNTSTSDHASKDHYDSLSHPHVVTIFIWHLEFVPPQTCLNQLQSQQDAASDTPSQEKSCLSHNQVEKKCSE